MRGAGKYSMRVWLDPNKLQYYGLTTLDVQRAIQSQNVEVGSGQLGGPPVPIRPAFQFTVNALGRLSDAEEFENIIVKSVRGETAQIVRVKDLARVELSQQTFSGFSQVFGKNARTSSSIPARRQRPGGGERGVGGGRGNEQDVPRRDDIFLRIQYDEVRSTGDHLRLPHAVRGGVPRTDRHHGFPAEPAGDAGAGDDGAGDDHRRVCRHGDADSAST